MMNLLSRLITGTLLGWLLIRITGADRIKITEAPVVPLMSFTPQLAVLGPIATLLLRCRSATVVGGLALGALVGSRAHSRTQPHATGAEVRVVTANLLYGRATAADVVALVRSTDAEVLFLQELTQSAVVALRAAGLDDLMPHNVMDVRKSSPRGSGIYARYPLSKGLSLKRTSAAQPTAQVTLPSGDVLELVCVHPHPPAPPWARVKVTKWRNEMAVLPAPADTPIVLAGDYNATLDHAHFRQLLQMGHVDAAQQTGNALKTTWGPLNKPGLLTLDHVLLDPRCAVLQTSIHKITGSDHRAVFACFQLPS